MTEDEIRKLCFTVNALFPTFNVENPDATVAAWHMALAEYPAEAVMLSLQMYVKTNNTAFAPSVAQLISGIYKPQERERLTEGEAWNLVKRAIQDGNYHAEERFNELPEDVQKAVGSPNMIQQWACTDSEDVNTVIMSNFQRNYRTVVQRSIEDAKISPLMMEMAKAIGDKQQKLLQGA